MTVPHMPLSGLLRRARHRAAGDWRPGPSDAAIAKALTLLRNHGHRSVRILDLDCGDGTRLIRAAATARELGFVAIEGRGTGDWSTGIRHARWQTEAETHPTTGLTFDLAEPMAALAAEHDGSADLILLSEPMPYPASPLAIALARVNAGTVLAA